MNLLAVRFVIAIVLGLGLTLAALTTTPRLSGSEVVAHRDIVLRTADLTPATVVVAQPRTTMSWRTLLPGSMR